MEAIVLKEVIKNYEMGDVLVLGERLLLANLPERLLEFLGES